MLRDVDIAKISDGKLYKAEDMVKIACSDCKGCSNCCKGMGNTIILDPYDVANLFRAVNKPFVEMIGHEVDFTMIDGIMSPVINMEKKGKCAFLNNEGRCSIHDLRPGFCRLFPLGRIYHSQDDGFDYFIQTKECSYPNKSKIKIKKWLGVPNLKEYDEYIIRWHAFTKEFRAMLQNVFMLEGKTETKFAEDGEMKRDIMNKYDEVIKTLNTMYVQLFFFTPYLQIDELSYIEQIYRRIESFGRVLKECDLEEIIKAYEEEK